MKRMGTVYGWLNQILSWSLQNTMHVHQQLEYNRQNWKGWDVHRGITRTPDTWSCIVFSTHLEIRQKGGNAWKKNCDDSMLKASINFAIGCGLQETYVSTWALSLLAKRSISGLSNKAKILWNMGNERIHSRFKITGLHQHCWTLEYGLPTNKKIIYLAHSKTCFISYNLW